MIEINEVENVVRESFKRAKERLELVKEAYEFIEKKAISDRIPGYKAELLDFGDFKQDKFSILFIDMRQSTKRAMKIGPKKTFLSMHTFIPAMLEVIKQYRGYVIDIMGDGIMVFFGGKESGLNKSQSAKNAGLCGLDMLLVLDKVVNKILDEEKIWKIECGVGIDYGDVVVTKIGVENIYDVKAYGDCINKAAKFAQDSKSEVLASKKIKELWPSSNNGKIKFNLYNLGKDSAYIIKR